jgi:hypothetical protein
MCSWLLDLPEERWAPGGSRPTKAMRVDVVIGIVVALPAAIELWVRWQMPSQPTANR